MKGTLPTGQAGNSAAQRTNVCSKKIKTNTCNNYAVHPSLDRIKQIRPNQKNKTSEIKN
jgi:hypothetical protein